MHTGQVPGRPPFLRRPGRRFDGDGAVLRPGQEARGPALGVDEGHLPQPDDPEPGDGARGRRAHGPGGPRCPRRIAGPGRRRWRWLRTGTPHYVLCGALQLLVFLGYSYLIALVAARGYAWISAGSGVFDTYLRSVLFGGGELRGPVRPSDPGRSGCSSAGGSRGSSASGAWRMSGSGSSRRWSARTRWSCSPGRRSTRCTCGRWARRSGRGVAIFSRNVPVCTDLLTIGDGHGDPQGLVLPRLPGPGRPDPDRPGHPRPGRVHRRDDRARHRHLDGRRGPARPRVLAAQRPGRARRRALARVPGAAHRRGLPAWSARPTAAPLRRLLRQRPAHC